MQKLMMNTDGNDDFIEVAVSLKISIFDLKIKFLLFSYVHFDI
jgi:hypothetical protein